MLKMLSVLPLYTVCGTVLTIFTPLYNIWHCALVLLNRVMVNLELCRVLCVCTLGWIVNWFFNSWSLLLKSVLYKYMLIWYLWSSFKLKIFKNLKFSFVWSRYPTLLITLIAFYCIKKALLLRVSFTEYQASIQ